LNLLVPKKTSFVFGAEHGHGPLLIRENFMSETARGLQQTHEACKVVQPPGVREYAGVIVALSAVGILIVRLTALPAVPAPSAQALLGPIFALVGLIAAVFVLMLVVRNYAAIRGLAAPAYYVTFRPADAPPDWIERPSRTYNNLMQLPVLFWLVCLLMMLTETLDAAQVALAWLFVAMRCLHAFIYISWNYLPARFGAFLAGVIALAVLWVRFAQQSWHLF
jgi:hypothetical protein